MSLENIERLNRLAEERRSLRTSELDAIPVVQKGKVLPYFGYVEVAIPDCPPVLMFSNNDDLVAMEIFWCGCFEPASVALWAVLAQEACPVILDVGSYTGLYGLLAAAISRQTKVITFEPVGRICARVLVNRAVNRLSNLEVCQIAIGATNNVADMNFYSGHGTLPTGSSLTVGSPRRPIYVEKVPVRSLDGLRIEKNWPRVGLVKIDVERLETEVLHGMRGILSNFRPDILIEILDRTALEAMFKELADLNLDYRCLHIEEKTSRYRELSEPDADLGKGSNFLLTVRSRETLHALLTTATTRAIARSETAKFPRSRTSHGAAPPA